MLPKRLKRPLCVECVVFQCELSLLSHQFLPSFWKPETKLGLYPVEYRSCHGVATDVINRPEAKRMIIISLILPEAQTVLLLLPGEVQSGRPRGSFPL